MGHVAKGECIQMTELLEKAERLKAASQTLAMLSTEEKNAALEQIAQALDRERAFILQENEKDMAQGREQGLSPALLDRLQLTNERLDQIIGGVRQVASLPDPVGEIVEEWTRPNGLRIQTVRVPLGVIGMVYEARPNVTVDAASLCLKTGNAVLLRGSSSALHSNKALVSVMKGALRTTAVPDAAIELLEDTRRETAQQMFRLNDYLDVLIRAAAPGSSARSSKTPPCPCLKPASATVICSSTNQPSGKWRSTSS
ncbi:Gamma-glutamyl phosphate reductase [Geobacillus sp. WSUCF1]|nr:Gamma-glutamyl phosphate reductase [Geobacillus sp. WSUCF1]